MIFDSIFNKENYKDHFLLYSALNYLSQLEPCTLPETTCVLIPERLFCNPVTLVSRSEEECRYEAHQRYIDLHYIVEGVEGIATADRSALSVSIPYDITKDIEFLDGIEDGRYYLKAGQFMVCFPNDAHKVAIMKDAPENIKKIVFKLKVEE